MIVKNNFEHLKSLNIRTIALRILEDTKCDLTCKGCYLVPEYGKSDGSLNDLFECLPNDVSVHHIFYFNNLNRSIIDKLDEFQTHYKEFYKNRKSMHRKKSIVMDSLTAKDFPSFTDLELKYDIEDIYISPRTKESVAALSNRLSRDGNNIMNMLFTVGVDNPLLIGEAILAGFKKFVISIRKPVNIKYYTEYYSTITKLEQMRLSGEILSFTRDTCLDYVQKGKNCRAPQDGLLETTTFLNNFSSVWMCSYPSETCIVNKKE